MKNFILSLLFLSLANLSFGQKDLSFTIQHLIGSEPFSTETSFTNNLGNSISPTTLKYYLSEISIIHDGGQVLPIEDLTLLVNAEENTEVNLTELEFTQIEAIQFHIGVPYGLNHADPALQPAGHPLAYQSPSMHWGWAGGYKFLVTEGASGAASNNFQIHSTGDALYTEFNIPLVMSTANASSISFVIEADYTQLYKDIQMENGLFNHGQDAEAAVAINNLANEVFTAGGFISNTKQTVFEGSYTFAPNPSTDGMVNLKADLVNFDQYTLRVRNMLGQEVQSFSFAGSQVDYMISNLNSGIFAVEVSNAEGVLFTEKIIVQ